MSRSGHGASSEGKRVDSRFDIRAAYFLDRIEGFCERLQAVGRGLVAGWDPLRSGAERVSGDLEFVVKRLAHEQLRCIDECVRPFMKDGADPDARVDVHKIVATTEWAVMSLLPLRRLDQPGLYGETARHDQPTCALNAHFAFFLGSRILRDYYRNGETVPERPIPGPLVRAHYKWLTNQAGNWAHTFPIFLDAQLWWCVEQFARTDMR